MITSRHVVLGLSGGVDSAVAGLLLKEQGYRVTGVFMKNWEEDDTDEYCSAAEDLRSATEVARILDIPLKTVNFSGEYWDRVFEYFLAEYKANRTPNPDVLCNKEIKFKAFLDYALSLGADTIATGHYAGIRKTGDRFELIKAKDDNKDQTYFLHLLDQAALSRSLFPLCDIPKPEIRRMAEAAGLPNADRKDSTGICFIGERNFRQFLSSYLPAQPGDIKTPDGELKGGHDGLMYYTIGQRQGLGVGGPGGPWFVVDKDIENNALIVSTGDDSLLYSPALETLAPHWIAGEAPGLPLACTARIRHRQPEQACTLFPSEQGLRVEFVTPQRAVTPGQSAVFYRGDVCLGGGIIRRSLGSASPDS
ncbi:MAG: tRNA 2-thiouridine(34) synthase MnmA [Gammaproteobacteria bacterium]|nr:tRNA 2-thiouridine(34) synthase MnmA [Gammaproteobacteria bacterium]